MATIKVIEAASEIYWETTHQGTVEVNGVEVEYRYNENSNGIELYIYEEDGWTADPSDDMAETYDLLWEMLGEFSLPDDLSEEGEEFEWEAE